MRGNHRQRSKLRPKLPLKQRAKRKKAHEENDLAAMWRRLDKKQAEEAAEKIRKMRVLIMAGKAAPMNRAKLRQYGRLLFTSPPDDSKYPCFYENRPFNCKDCGKHEIWTAQQQKWWHEEIGGCIETTAVRCRECRAKERARKAEVNRLRIEGLERKRLRIQKRGW